MSTYNVARAISNFLGQMAEGGVKLGDAVIKELMQNADDAGAIAMCVLINELSKIRFTIDL